MALLVKEILEASPNSTQVKVDRHTLYKRRWRAQAEDGTELAVDLESPVNDQVFLKAQDGSVFQIEQKKEELIVISLPNNSEMAAKLGWYLGNQHLPVEIKSKEIILEKINTLEASLDRIGIPFTHRTDVFHCTAHSHQH